MSHEDPPQGVGRPMARDASPAEDVLMSLATHDDLDRYLAANVRVVSVESGVEHVGAIVTGIPGAGVIELRRPAQGEDVAEWRTLVSDLQPHVLIVGTDDGLLEATGYAHMSRRSPLLRNGEMAVDYQWMMVGDQIALVLTARGEHGLASLDHADLLKVGSLAKGLVHAG